MYIPLKINVMTKRNKGVSHIKEITTIDSFWETIDYLRIEQQLSWKQLFGCHVPQAMSKQWNIPLNQLFRVQDKLNVSLVNLLLDEEVEIAILKNPATPDKMLKIYQWTAEENWMENPETVKKVQSLAQTID